MSSYTTMMTEMLLFLLRLLRVCLLALGFLISFLSNLGGVSKIDLPLSTFSLANSFLTSLFLVLTLLARGIKIVVLVKAILGEEKSYLKSVRLKADF